MTLPVPKLDSRTYDELVRDALRRLPLYAPEYTNHNESDPGRAIIEANAFLTEALLYQINRVPDKTYVSFLNLVGITPRPADAARTDLAFTLKDLKDSTDPLSVNIPLGTQVAVDDPDLEEEVIFETDAAFRALNAGIATALTPRGETPETWQAVTRFDSEGEKTTTWLHAFHPFGEAEAVGRQFIFALVLRPKAEGETPEDRMPAGPIDLFIEAQAAFATGADGTPIEGLVADSKGPLAPAPDAPPPVKWEVFAGSESPNFTFGGTSGWQDLAITRDETEGLRRTGHIVAELPDNMVSVRFAAVPSETWQTMGRVPVPATQADLVALLASGSDLAEELKLALSVETLEALGVTDPTGMLADCAGAADLAAALSEPGVEIDPAALAPETWGTLHPDFAAPDFPTVIVEKDGEEVPVLLPLYFFRATLQEPMPTPRRLSSIRLNTVKATAASTRRDERLGVSNGRPGQSFTLSRAPVYIDPLTGAPDLTLSVVLDGVAEPWERVDDFHAHGPAEKVFALDPLTGEIRFGDGRGKGIGGAIPPAAAQIVVTRYRFGGGSIGNVAAGVITKVKGALSNVKSVTNPRQAIGGADAQTLEEAKRSAPATLRRRERAVTAEDFADLAKATPGAGIHKAYAIAAKVPNGDRFDDRPGAVSVVVLPNDASRDPDRLAQTLREVRQWLDRKRLVSTELHVVSARYFMIQGLTAKLRIARDADMATVTEAAKAALQTWLDPITGGEEGTGWPFGSDIYHGDLYDVLLAVPGVERVSRLALTHDRERASSPADVVQVPEGYLPALAAGAIGFEVSYD